MSSPKRIAASQVSTDMRGAAVDAVLMAALVAVIAGIATAAGEGGSVQLVTHTAILLTAVSALQIFSGNTGIVSFGHAAFMALGAYTVALLTMSPAIQAIALRGLPAPLAGHELSLPMALGAAALLGLVFGAVTGLLLFRLAASAASISTLALLIIVYSVLVGTREVTRGSQPLYGIPRNLDPWMAVLIAIGALVVARLFRASSVGLAARAAMSDEIGASAAGVNRPLMFFVAWISSAVVASVAGGLMAQFLGAITPHGFFFDLAFTLLAMLIIGGMNSSLGALAGVIVTTLLIEITRRFEGGISIGGFEVPAIFGLTPATLALCMLLVIWRRPDGLSRGVELDLLRRWRRSAPAPQESSVATAAAAPADALQINGITKRYSGLVAVDDVSLTVQPNVITGIIGPNGAGKTTLINLISGHTSRTSGVVRLGDVLLPPAPHRIARSGIARTFQSPRLFRKLTVLENVVTAASQARAAHRDPPERVAWRELETLGLSAHAHEPAGSLAYGLQRRLEIARALALAPRFLLLDEPAAGLNPAETHSLIDVLRREQQRRGFGILVIEHDLALIMSLCERVVVLDQGRVIADGAPAQIQRDSRVIAAYLGSRTAQRATQGAQGSDSSSEAPIHV